MSGHSDHLRHLVARTKSLTQQWMREAESLDPRNAQSVDHFAITTAALQHACQLILDRASAAAEEALDK